MGATPSCQCWLTNGATLALPQNPVCNGAYAVCTRSKYATRSMAAEPAVLWSRHVVVREESCARAPLPNGMHVMAAINAIRVTTAHHPPDRTRGAFIF